MITKADFARADFGWFAFDIINPVNINWPGIFIPSIICGKGAVASESDMGNNIINNTLREAIKPYPDTSEIALELRPLLHPRFQGLLEGISEFTFANLYLFRSRHNYRISRIEDDLLLIIGRDKDNSFFMLPLGLPSNNYLDRLFNDVGFMKAVSEPQAGILTRMGYQVMEDRDNFDYLFSRAQLASLTGRKFHKKKNLVNIFVKNNHFQAKPLLEQYLPDALLILDAWKAHQPDSSDTDYSAARQALHEMENLQLCGGIVYVDEKPVSYILGEELAGGNSYVIHFEKAITVPRYKGVYQFINQAFAAVLPEKYQFINREQDLGDPGLRQAKESYNPVGFVKKYRADLPGKTIF